MKRMMKLIPNIKSCLFQLICLGIGGYLFYIVIPKINPSMLPIPLDIWFIFLSGTLFLLLPHVSKITIGNVVSIERDLKKVKEDFELFRTQITTQLITTQNTLAINSQNVSNNVTIDVSPNEIRKKYEEVLCIDSEHLDIKKDLSQKIDSELNRLTISTHANRLQLILAFLRIYDQIEAIIDKNIDRSGSKDITQAFNDYCNKYERSKKHISAFDLFNTYLNSITLGARIEIGDYEKVKDIAIRILRVMKINSILESTND